jgi:hypothetical protein
MKGWCKSQFQGAGASRYQAPVQREALYQGAFCMCNLLNLETAQLITLYFSFPILPLRKPYISRPNTSLFVTTKSNERTEQKYHFQESKPEKQQTTAHHPTKSIIQQAELPEYLSHFITPPDHHNHSRSQRSLRHAQASFVSLVVTLIAAPSTNSFSLASVPSATL